MVEERRRHLQHAGYVVEAIALGISRQQRGCIDPDAQNVLDLVRVLGPVQPMHDHVARVGMRGSRGIQVSLQEMDGRIDLALIRLRLVRRRHETAAQFANGLFPHLGILADAVGGHRVERYATGPIGRVVALAAILIEEGPFRRIVRGPVRRIDWSRRRRGDRCRGSRRRSRDDARTEREACGSQQITNHVTSSH